LIWLVSSCALLLAQGPQITSVSPAAGGGAALCPGDQASVKGANLNGVTVTVGGKPAYVLDSTASGLLIQIPVDAPVGPTTITAGGSSPFNITLNQFAPAVPVNPNAGLANAATLYHLPAQDPVTASYPASPNEQLALVAFGLGPTRPAIPTGKSASDASAFTNTQPSVQVGGKPAKVIVAFAYPGQIAAYAVVFTMPADAAAGNSPLSLTIGGATSNAVSVPVVSNGPLVSQVVNAGSYIPAGLPNSAIAQGAIFVIKGAGMGPSAIAIAPAAFQNTTLAGTSVNVTVAGTSVGALLYYTSAGQIAALLPSNTPTGTGTLTVTYNGQTSSSAPITVVGSNAGIFTVTSDGQGAGIVTYADYSLVSAARSANCGGVYTACGAANPGDVLIIWATGLGPVNGSDAGGAGLGGDMTGLPLTVWLGGVQAPVAYRGRSGCCIGEDQVVITVPNNVATGCAVPLAIQIGNFISNNVVVPVANGSRTCTPANPGLTRDNVLQLSGNTPVTYGSFELTRNDNYPGFAEVGKATFGRVTVDPAYQPFIASYIDGPPPGTCLVSNNLTSGLKPPFQSQTGLDAGGQLSITGPNGSKSIAGAGGAFKGTLSPNGTYLAPGGYTLGVSGGADVPAFTTNFTIPALPTMTTPTPDSANAVAVTRSAGFNVTWAGGSSNSFVSLNGSSATDSTLSNGAAYQCTVLTSAGSFSVPPYVLLALPAGNFGGMYFRPSAIPASFSGTALNLASISARYEYFTPLSLK
jgi:uncharacterized protein (TIGR03437 family)